MQKKRNGRLKLELPALDTRKIFLEADGNELVDAGTCFNSEDMSKLLRCLVQAKFSGERTVDPKQRYAELRSVIDKMFELDPDCLPVFVTNRKTPADHVAFLRGRRRFILYDFHTIKDFLGRSLHPLVPCAEF
jgi:hypothetical protein